MTDTTATTDQDVEVLDGAPNLTGLYARAARPGGGGGGSSLPTRRVQRRDIRIDRDHVADYADLCGFRLTDALPITYLHMLAFPLQIQLMAGNDLPFPLLGMVHLRQRIDAHRAVTADEAVTVTVGLQDLRPHAKGQQFTVLSTAAVGDETVWVGTSTYLHRGGSDDDVPPEQHPADAVEVASLPTTARWSVPDDIGRDYGAVSGDRNPIHLSRLTAKPFGFRSAIAHGMWTLARSVAGLEGRLPDAVSVDVAFKTPLFLPSTVEYATEARDDGWAFGLRNAKSGKPHLAGATTNPV